MEIEVKNVSGQLMNSTTIDPSIWDVEYNADLLHQAIYVYLANVRQWNSSTKSRSENKVLGFSRNTGKLGSPNTLYTW